MGPGHPGARALIAGPDALTYGELDARADRLAHRLLASGPLPPGALVAVGTARQSELIVALLAVLKAGGSYTVIDVESPRSGRRQLAAAEPLVLLTDAAQHAALDNGGGPRVIRLDADATAIGGPRTEQPADRPADALAEAPADAPADLSADPPADRLPGTVTPPPGRTAAVLFTGAAEPRAVPVGHGMLLAAHEGWAEVARPAAQDRHLFTVGPDVTAFAAGWTRALCSGGALVLSPRAAWKPEDIRAAVETDRVTVLHTDPAGAARLLIEDAEQGSLTPAAHLGADPACRSLRLLAVSGGRLYLDEQATLQVRLRPGARVLNVYGSAECAGIGTWFELPQLPHPLDDPEQISLLGTAFPGFRAEVHGGEIRLVPPDGADAIPTGDLGLLREDGLLEYGGRLRDRITLPGGRWLDPYPVESAIRSHEGIGAVILKGSTARAARGGSSRTWPHRPADGPGPPGSRCRTSRSCATTWRARCSARSPRAPSSGCAPCPAPRRARRTGTPCRCPSCPRRRRPPEASPASTGPPQARARPRRAARPAAGESDWASSP